MERRSFLGSLLGSVISLPFLARLESDEWQRVISPYRMLFKDSISGLFLQAPGVKVERTDCHTGCRLTFRSEGLVLDKPMIVDKFVLLTENGDVISERPASCWLGFISLQENDKFYCQHSLIFDYDYPTDLSFIPSTEELVKAYKEIRNGKRTF